MKIPLYQVDAFTREPFGGNPAAVCPLSQWLPDATMQAIAAENNLAETAFFVPQDGEFHLRWFSPVHEVKLCGHATLASAYVLFNVLEPDRKGVRFHTLSGPLGVERDGGRFTMDFPALPLEKQHEPTPVADALGVSADSIEVWEADRAMAVLRDPAAVRDLKPDIGKIEALPFSTLIVTARGFEGDCDFVSRFFAPKYGIPEDPVTGSAHCVLTPYWAAVLGKSQMFARQLSRRGGELWVEHRGDRVRLSGEAVSVMQGTFEVR